MTALREAAQQALEALELRCGTNAEEREPYGAITALRAALAQEQAEPEPVAWMYEDTLPKEYPYDAMWLHSAVRDGVRMFPVFAPPQRKPLTDEDVRDVIALAMQNITKGGSTFSLTADGVWREIIKTVEAKLKEKNA